MRLEGGSYVSSNFGVLAMGVSIAGSDFDRRSDATFSSVRSDQQITWEHNF